VTVCHECEESHRDHAVKIITIRSKTALIDTQSLKNKILDLAIRGKLTRQLPDDGTAEELYEKIQEEKQALVEAGKTKKEKPLKEIEKDEVPFEVPGNWKWVRFGEVSFIERGGSPRPIKQYLTNNEKGINWIKIGDVEKGGKYIFSTKEKIIPEGEKKSRKVYPEDFLLTNSMSFGRPYISKIEGCIHDGWLVIRNYGGFDADYLYHLLSSGYLYEQFCQKAAGSTVSNLNIDKVNSAIMPLPPLCEQKRIVNIIEELFAEIETIEKLQNQYAADAEILKSKLIDAAIQGKLTEQLPSDGTAEELYQQIQEEKKALIESGKIKKEKPLKEIEEDEIPFEIPESWKWCRIKDIGITVTGSTPPKKQPEYYGGNYPFYKPADLDKGEHIITASEYLTEAGKKVARQFEKGTILVCCIGSLGKCAVIDEDGTANQQINALTPILCNSDYLLYCISSEFFKTQLQQESRATTVSIIKKSKFDTCILPIPPLGEQKRIVDRVEEVLQYC